MTCEGLLAMVQFEGSLKVASLLTKKTQANELLSDWRCISAVIRQFGDKASVEYIGGWGYLMLLW